MGSHITKQRATLKQTFHSGSCMSVHTSFDLLLMAVGVGGSWRVARVQ